jgi:hypothetical protein
VDERHIPGTFAMDSYFTNAPILNHIHGKQGGDGWPRGYVGSLKLLCRPVHRSWKASTAAGKP